MGTETKRQAYTYSLKTGLMQSTVCSNKQFAYLVPPQDALTIENCFTHIVIDFDVGVASGNRVLEQIGIASNYPLTQNGIPARLQTITLNQAADGNRRVDVKIDLTHLLDRTATAYFSRFDSTPTSGLTMVYFKLPDALYSSNSGTMIWKTDSLYTTTGIR